MSKIGIFAGAFDPVHDGHIAFARKALENGLEKVYFLPEANPRMKPNVSDINERISIISKEIEHYPNFETIRLKQNNFEVQSVLTELSQMFPDDKFVFLFGDDVIEHLASWKDLDIFASQVELMIATRKHSTDKINQMLSDFKSEGLVFNYHIIELDQDISSTQIRATR